MKHGECKYCLKNFCYYPSNKAGIYCSIRCCNSDPERNSRIAETKRGGTISEAQKLAVSRAMLGKPKPKEQIAKRIATLKRNYDRKGRKTVGMNAIRVSSEYKSWRKQVFERDKYACTNCGDSTGGNLEADHIISLSFLFEESKRTRASNFYDTDNGRTLCTNCHKKTESYAKHWKHHIEGRLMLAIENIGLSYDSYMETIIEQLKEKIG